MNEFIFKTDYLSKENKDKLIELFGKESAKRSYTNPERVYHVLYVYHLINQVAKGKRVKVSYELCEPYANMGSVSIDGCEVVFMDSKEFLKGVELSNNFDVYPKTNGIVHIDFTFYGLKA